MIKGSIRDKIQEKSNIVNMLTAANILKRISDEDIFHHYIEFKLNVPFHSPFPPRDDNPSFIIKRTEGGNTRAIDFRREGVMNVFEFLQEYLHLSYGKVLETIDKDLNLHLLNPSEECTLFNPQEYKKKAKLRIKAPSTILVYHRDFNNQELDYWNSFYITQEELSKNYIYAIDKAYIDGQRLLNPKNVLRFDYLFPISLYPNLKYDRDKIYSPNACKDNKWKSNVPNSIIEHLGDLGIGEKNIITKSRKDRIVLQKFIKTTCNTQNENNSCISKEDIGYIKDYGLNIWTWFDNDETGIETGRHYKESNNFSPIIIPKDLQVKDPSEFIAKYGQEKLKQFLQENNLI